MQMKIAIFAGRLNNNNNKWINAPAVATVRWNCRLAAKQDYIIMHNSYEKSAA